MTKEYRQYLGDYICRKCDREFVSEVGVRRCMETHSSRGKFRAEREAQVAMRRIESAA